LICLDFGEAQVTLVEAESSVPSEKLAAKTSASASETRSIGTSWYWLR
jgi:hypothetical protein